MTDSSPPPRDEPIAVGSETTVVAEFTADPSTSPVDLDAAA